MVDNMTKSILGATTGLMASSLAIKSAKMAQDAMKQKHAKPMKMVKGFTEITIGTALLGPTSKLINDM